jgi:RNA polymerase sigma-70 factor (ECF subfamily)
MADDQEFEAFVKRHQDGVFSTAVRLVANPAEAEDIAQEVFLKAYERFAELSQSPTVGWWLKRVATNLSLNYLSRYRARWSFFSELFRGDDGEDTDRKTEADFAAPGDLCEELAVADRHRQIERELRNLPDAQRVPLVLFHLEGLSYKEIAAKLKISIGRVKTDIFRGRGRLRTKLHSRSRAITLAHFSILKSGRRALPAAS